MFSAEFLDGPMEGSSHTFLGADAPFEDLYAIPHPTEPERPWIIVGYTGMEPDEPWPSQVHYGLSNSLIVSEARLGQYTLSP